MPKHIHLQSMAEQIIDKGHGEAPFHYAKTSGLISKSEEDKSKRSVDDIAIRQLAYEIFQEKGGSDLDNWFEAERSLSNNF